MGHNLLPTLPTSKKWRDVVESVASGADAPLVAALSAEAVEAQLREGPRDPVYQEAIRILTLAPMAARETEVATALRALGLEVGEAPDLTDFVFAACDRLDQVALRGSKANDFGELTRRALVAAFSSTLGGEMPGLVETTPADLDRALRRFSQPREFTRLARAFFSKLLSETLSSFLDRALADHVGPGARFAHLGERSSFDNDLRTYCFETTRIIHEFSNGWYGKHAYGAEGISDDAVATYGHVAFRKILAEMSRRERAA